MKIVLGLDIGTNSIGWALVHEPEESTENYSIAGIGVRIIPLSSDENDEFTKGNAISKNANRTLKRGARRNLHRYKLRKQQLSSVMQALNIFPDAELFKLDALSLYGLRDKAINEQISLKELGRILYHLNQKRGYKSNRKANNDEDKAEAILDKENIENAKIKKKGYLDLINDRELKLKEESLTIGQHFFNELKINPCYRIKENIYLRSTYITEFDQIWNMQQKFYPDILTEANKHKIRNEIIYFHRPLKSQKGLVSNCIFEKYHKAIPKSSPLFQMAKIWQELNTIEITSFKAMLSHQEKVSNGKELGFDKYGKRPLTIEEKQNLFKKLNIKGKLTTKEVLTELGYKSGYNEYKLNIRNEKELEGNRTYAALNKVLNNFSINPEELLQFNLNIKSKEKVDKITGEISSILVVDESFEREPLYRLWHLLYSVEDNEPLLKKLQSSYGFSEEQANSLVKIDFQKQGYGNLSARALRNILPYLQMGEMYDKACKLAGYNHSASVTKEENETRNLIDKLDLYPKNSLRQPVVEKIINQVINLVNEIIDEKNGFISKEERYAKNKFEIRVELARELRQNAEERNRTYSRNSRLDKKHKEIGELLHKELGFKRVSRNDIERFKLWEEFGKVSPYEPTKPISLSQLFNQVQGDFYDIEHIIPKSRLFDDSFNNKTICPRRLNSGESGKNQLTAYDFMRSRGEQAFNNYLEFIKSHLYKKDGISKAKFDKLMMAVEKIPEDFINRQLQETRFISREVRKLLSMVCRNVYATSGTVTSKLVHLWGWDEVSTKLQIEKYRNVGLAEEIEYVSNGQSHKKEIIKNWNKREDHRHHAIDALCIACTKQGFIQRINQINSQFSRDEIFAEVKSLQFAGKLSLLERYLVSNKPFQTNEVCNVVDSILISFKPGKKVGSNSLNKIKKGKKILHTKMELTPRGFLHKETIYGRIKQLEKISLSPKFNRLDDIIDDYIKHQVEEQLLACNNDPKLAFNSKNLKVFEERTGIKHILVYKFQHVVKYKLDVNFKVADAEYIVDIGVRTIIKKRLTNYDNNPKEAFRDLNGNPIWLNESKGVSIKSVRCFTGLSDLQPLHKNKDGNPIDFVSTRNNHHIAIYKDETGKLFENTVTFWDALERKKSGIPVIVTQPKSLWDELLNIDFDNQGILKKLPRDNWTYITSLQQNEMFVFGLDPSETNLYDHRNSNLISKHLFRVQKIAESYYSFRHHLETTVDDKYDGVKNENLSITIGKYKRIQSLPNMTGIKVRINNLGRITQVENYNSHENAPNSIVTEPETVYQKTSLRAFGTHDEMNEADAKEMAALSPAEHLQNAADLTRKLFAEELKKPMNKKLRFR